MAFLPAIFKRFPLVMAACLVGVWASLAIAGAGYFGRPSLGLSYTQGLKLLMTAYLGIGLLFSLALIGEGWTTSWARYLLQSAGIALLVGYFLAIDGKNEDHMWVRFLTCFVAVKVLLLSVPLLRRSGASAFWHFCSALFMRIGEAASLSITLWFGMFLTTLGHRDWLGWKALTVLYAPILLLPCTLMPWFVLARTPRGFDPVEWLNSPEQFLRTLSKYLLIPLVGINVILQYAYAVQVLTADVPSGGWPNMRIKYPSLDSSGFGIFFLTCIGGILSFKLYRAACEEEGRPLAKTLTCWFYHSQWPLLLFLAMDLWL